MDESSLIINDGGADDDEFWDLIYAGIAIVLVYFQTFLCKQPCMTSSTTGSVWLSELMSREANRERCYRMFRMDKEVFYELLHDMATHYGLKGSRNIAAEEMLAICLHILGHGVSNRLTQERFQHSGETISRIFGRVLQIICEMAKDLIQPYDREFREIPEKIKNDSRYYPHFKDCIGVIDGTHIHAVVPIEDQVRFIGRKGTPTQNVLAVCNFNMEFIYVLAGWEGTAHDTRIFYDAIRRAELNFPHPPAGKYYLVDAGYPNVTGYLGPYKDVRYHLPDFQYGPVPTEYKEVFNKTHSSLRSEIERSFGVLKKKWKILKTMPSYPYRKQVEIVVATAALHNYIRRHSGSDRDFKEAELHIRYEMRDDNDDDSGLTNNINTTLEMSNLRDEIAASLMR